MSVASGCMLLACTLGYNQHCMTTAAQPLLEDFIETHGSFKVKRDFGNKHIIDLIKGQGSIGGNKSGHPAHYLDNTDTVRSAHRFDMGASDCFSRYGEGGFQAEGLLDIGNIVVNSFGNTNNRYIQTTAADFFVDGLSAMQGAVTADSK